MLCFCSRKALGRGAALSAGKPGGVAREGQKLTRAPDQAWGGGSGRRPGLVQEASGRGSNAGLTAPRTPHTHSRGCGVVRARAQPGRLSAPHSPQPAAGWAPGPAQAQTGGSVPARALTRHQRALRKTHHMVRGLPPHTALPPLRLAEVDSGRV